MLPWRFILSINKFSKYGIVLVAAITLATAVQTQFGQSSTKVYAEETASDANYNDWRMFYVYSADYPDKPDSGSMSGRVIKPSEPYVVDENFRNPGTYSHYDVFDDTGKHYNVGDIITVNDPLVNHKNEEDNRLYYYYYPLNSDNTSEAPANSTTPATSEAPAVSTTPATSEAPAVSTTPATSETPAVSTTPATSEANLNNYRMFYIKDSFYPNLKDYKGFAGRVTTADKPYTVEKGVTISEYPYYTIVGSDGKTYSVGDTITVNNPLVNHPDENDNVLHYYYYPFNPNSVSEAPAVSTTPATSEAPAVSTTPATSENPISDNDPSLDRMLYLDYALSDDPKISWLTGNVVTPKGYIVKPADEVEGYPYYTITGSNGKKYSVGDVITTEEPGLFGHANYEDDALYYRYYRTNPNSVSEAPAVSETPATSEAPAVSTTPATSLVPSKNIHSMNSVTSPFTQTRNAGIKSEADGKLTSHDLPKTGDTNSKVGMLGMVLVGLGLTSFVYKGRHRRS